MDIEEIKCALCGQVYNESDRLPILLPDCGHSFCLGCIQDCFELLKQDQHNFAQSPASLKMAKIQTSSPFSDKQSPTSTDPNQTTVIMQTPFNIVEESS